MMPDYFKKFQKLTGYDLKIIALISMLIDHIGVGLISQLYEAGYFNGRFAYDQVNTVYKIFRLVGRISFPIYCFLLVEAFFYTRSRLKYIIGLLLFGFISEVPYDITLHALHDNEHSNVFFTLFISCCVIWALDRLLSLLKNSTVSPVFIFIMGAGVTAVGVITAEIIHCDYHGYGIGVITALYVLRSVVPLNLFAAYAVILPLEANALPGFLIPLFYNKKRGKKLGRFKYLFYVFYPAHLLIIYLIRKSLIGA